MSEHGERYAIRTCISGLTLWAGWTAFVMAAAFVFACAGCADVNAGVKTHSERQYSAPVDDGRSMGQLRSDNAELRQELAVLEAENQQLRQSLDQTKDQLKDLKKQRERLEKERKREE